MMDKEWIRGQLVGYWVATLDVQPNQVATAKDIATNYVDRIAAQHEADKRDAMECQDAAWHDIEQGYLSEVKALRQERDDAEAQVAVMYQALERLVDLCGPVYVDEPPAEIEWREATEVGKTALSAAPSVAARLRMWLEKIPGNDERILAGTGQEAWLSLGTLEFGRFYDVLVLGLEQPQSSKREE